MTIIVAEARKHGDEYNLRTGPEVIFGSNVKIFRLKYFKNSIISFDLIIKFLCLIKYFVFHFLSEQTLACNKWLPYCIFFNIYSITSSTKTFSNETFFIPSSSNIYLFQL